MKKIKVGVVGCGKISDCEHIPALLKLKNRAVISSLFDVDMAKAESAKNKHKLQSELFDSFNNLLKSDIDAVVVATPNTLHYSQAMSALKAGKHVLVEKPMATTLGEADKMIEYAKSRKLTLQVNQSLRFHPVYLKIKELIEQGSIGELIHLRCIRANGFTPDKAWSPGARWFTQKKFRGGLVMDIAVHMADMLCWYAGRPDKIYATVSTRVKNNDVPDNVSALMNYKSGATACLELSWTIPKGAALLEIYGEKGSIRLGFDSHNIQVALAGKEYKTVKPRKARSSHQCFVDAINGKTVTPVPGEVGRAALACCLAIEQSARTGRAVKA